MSLTLEDYRKDFERATNRSISMPVAGAIVWLVVAIISTQVNERLGLVILLFASGAIFPVALLIARLRSESVLSRENPLARLMGMSVLMVNLLWAVHIPLFIYVPAFLPLSLGIGLGLHWVIFLAYSASPGFDSRDFTYCFGTSPVVFVSRRSIVCHRFWDSRSLLSVYLSGLVSQSGTFGNVFSIRMNLDCNSFQLGNEKH